MDCKISIMCDCFDSETIDELNKLSETCQFRIIKQKGLLIPPEVITIIFEFIKNVGYSASYDVIKLSLDSIISKFKFNLNRTNEKESRIVVISGDKKAEFIIPFKLTKKQKDKIIETVAEKILEL